MPAEMKKVIAETFFAMAQKKDIDKITVTALIKECDISRQTFYYHFQDIVDVIEWIIHRETQQLIDSSLKAETPKMALRIFVASLNEKHEMVVRLMQSQKREQVERMVAEGIGIYFREVTRNTISQISMSPSDLDAMIDFYAFGITGLILKYCQQRNMDGEALVDQIFRIMPREVIELMSEH